MFKLDGGKFGMNSIKAALASAFCGWLSAAAFAVRSIRAKMLDFHFACAALEIKILRCNISSFQAAHKLP